MCICCPSILSKYSSREMFAKFLVWHRVLFLQNLSHLNATSDFLDTIRKVNRRTTLQAHLNSPEPLVQTK